MPTSKNKRPFLGISGLSPQAIEALRERARANHRSVSGELRAIIQAELSAMHHALDARPSTKTAEQ